MKRQICNTFGQLICFLRQSLQFLKLTFLIQKQTFTIAHLNNMHSILNHDSNVSGQPNSSNNLQNNNTVPIMQGSNLYQKNQTNQTYKASMQQLYKNQLDTLMEDKEKQKKLQKEMFEREKQEYRQRVKTGQQNQKLKDLAYKNYYKMLMDSQQQNATNFISPYEVRDKLKENHIQNSIEQEMKRSQNFEYQRRFQEAERKNNYREELNRQLQERKRMQSLKKNNIQQENYLIRQHTRGPLEIQHFQRQKKKQEMQMYRLDLDKLMQDKLSQSRKNIQVQQSKASLSEHYHNPLINPLPYNIQNPYLLKQMQKLSTPSIRKDYQYQDETNYQQDPKQRNESSYFARQGNNLLQ